MAVSTVALLVLIACVGCGPTDALRATLTALAPDDDEALALRCIDALRAREFATIEAQLAPALLGEGLAPELERMAAIVDQEAVSVELVGCNVHTTPDRRRSSLTYEYGFASHWAIATVTVDTREGSKQVVGMHVRSMTRSLEQTHRFTFEDKTWRHTVAFALLLALPAFVIFSLVVCARTRIARRKWLWIVFILFGFGDVGFNWSDGNWSFNPLSIQVLLFSASIAKFGLYAPWVVKLAFPLGGVVFLLRRKSLVAHAGGPPPLPQTAGPSAPAGG